MTDGRAFAFLLAFVLPSVAFAHGGLLSQGEYRFEDGEVRAKLVFASQELATSVKGTDGDADEDLSAAELETEATRAALEKGLLGKIAVAAPDGACVPSLGTTTIVEGSGVELEARWRCPAGSREAAVDATFLETFDAGHRHLVTMLGTTSSDVSIAVAGNQKFSVSGTASGKSSHLAFIADGVKHILEGWDHLLFLFALVLVGGKLRSLIAVVTAFTVGHSLSLAIGTFGWWVPPSSWIEPLIALSIAWVGVENFFVEDAAKRWRITLPFGFIHGFGFAGILRERALSPSEIPMAVLTFNFGVELGQLAVLVLILPLILWARKQSWFGKSGIRAVSGVVIAVGLALFFQRILSA